ncbi:MAG: type II secretion system F family protein [Candidatus Omnitrophica bacterium]|nr:type II secretion system F family protein [Candidatus Omnitrophota bacterium]
MPKFIVTAKDQAGLTKTQVLDTPDKNHAINIVQKQGLFVVSIEGVDNTAAMSSSPVLRKPTARTFSHTGANLDDIVSFSKQLATMLEAGVPLLRSLTVIADQVESRELARILSEVRADVESGQSFSKSLGKHPRVFSPFWVSLVEVGEASGTMPKILIKLTEYMEQAAQFQSQITGALIYPAVLVCICIGAILVFALFVGPTFEKIFKDMHIQLPGITVMMLAFFSFIKTKILYLVGGIILGLFLFKNYIKTRPGRLAWEAFLFSMPVGGPVIKLVVIEKFASQMAILVESGVPILYALEISERLVDNLICGSVIKDIREAVKEGKLLADPMERSNFFPPMAVQMIRVGEETGELGQMLNHVARFYKSQVEEFVKRFGTLIEPFMLVFMGIIIGTIVVSMFLPILSLSTGGG